MEGKSTIDAIMKLKRIVMENLTIGRKVVLVSFDIANALSRYLGRLYRRHCWK